MARRRTTRIFRFRPARPGDAVAMSGLISDLGRYFLADPEDPAAAAVFFDAMSVQATQERLSDPRYRHHVAVATDGLAGFVTTLDRHHLYQLFVAERYHRQGLGRRLWALARSAENEGGHDGRYTVNASLYAVPFYLRLGFRESGALITRDGICYQPMECVAEAALKG